MKFLDLSVGAEFRLNNSGVLVKASDRSYRLKGSQITKCKGSGRYYMPKSNPNPDVIPVIDSKQK